MNRKGTEKPIEIFVALFIILAVALVILKLFSGQITTQTAVLNKDKLEAAKAAMASSVKIKCQESCSAAVDSGCSQKSLAEYCITSSADVLSANQYLDLNNNNILDMDTKKQIGLGVCEDRVYCFQLQDECCERTLTAQSCVDILANFWSSTRGVAKTKAAMSDLYASQMPAGSCSASPLMWNSPQNLKYPWDQ